jgi:hypothetical protein
MNTSLDPGPEARAARRTGGVVRREAETNGASRGTNGASRRGLWRALSAIVAILAVVCAINVLSHLQDAANVGLRLPAWQAATWEATSAVAAIGACVVIWAALRIAPPRRGRWGVFLVVHAPAALIFSGVHVLGMWALRIVVYAAAGSRYRMPLIEFPYELRKDLLAYAGFAAVLWTIPRLTFGSPSPAVATTPPSQAACFDIQDGARLLRIPIGEILAVRAAGNYVEFLLDDGRRPLMRTPLGEIESALGPSGFLRTHRSWIVNAARVRALEPSGSGDHRVALDGGETAPVSRRFPDALERLRGGP